MGFFSNFWNIYYFGAVFLENTQILLRNLSFWGGIDSIRRYLYVYLDFFIACILIFSILLKLFRDQIGKEGGPFSKFGNR